MLYKSKEIQEKHEKKELVPNISADVINDLGLGEYLELEGSALSDYLSTDRDTIAFRQAVFADVIENPKLGDVLLSVFPILNDIIELRRLDSSAGDSGDRGSRGTGRSCLPRPSSCPDSGGRYPRRRRCRFPAAPDSRTGPW